MTTKLTETLAPLGAQAKLYTTAADALRLHRLDVDKALPAFHEELKNRALQSALEIDYLNRVAADMRHATRTAAADTAKVKAATTPGHAASETQISGAGGHLSTTAADAQTAEAATSPGHSPIETHRTGAGAHLFTAAEAEQADAAAPLGHRINEAQLALAEGPPSTEAPRPTAGKKKTDLVVPARGREGPHRRKMPTEIQRQAAIEVAQRITLFDSWKVRGKRRIGDLFVHELRTRALESVKTGFGFVVRGKDDLVDGIAEQLIAQHVQTSDPMARVRDVINEATLKQVKAKAIQLAKRGIDRVNQMPREMLAEIANSESEPASSIEQH